MYQIILWIPILPGRQAQGLAGMQLGSRGLGLSGHAPVCSLHSAALYVACVVCACSPTSVYSAALQYLS